MIYECSVHPDLPRFPHTWSCPQGGMEEHKEKFLRGESAWNSKPTSKLLPRQSLKLKSLETAQYWNHREPSAERIMATEVQSDRLFILASSGKKKMKKIWLISFPALFYIRVSGNLDLKAQQWWCTLWYVVVSISSMAMPHICHLWHATTLFKKAAKKIRNKISLSHHFLPKAWQLGLICSWLALEGCADFQVSYLRRSRRPPLTWCQIASPSKKGPADGRYVDNGSSV